MVGNSEVMAEVALGPGKRGIVQVKSWYELPNVSNSQKILAPILVRVDPRGGSCPTPTLTRELIAHPSIPESRLSSPDLPTAL
jgi:hypothetical protein